MSLSEGPTVRGQYAADLPWKERVVVFHEMDNDYSASFPVLPVTLCVQPAQPMRRLPPFREQQSGVEEDNGDLVDVTSSSETAQSTSASPCTAIPPRTGPASTSEDDAEAEVTLDARSDARRQYEPMSPAERRARVLRRRRAGAADLLGIGSAAQTPTGAVLAADAGPAPPVSISTSLEPRALQESVHATDGFVGVDAIDDEVRTMPMKRREATHERFCARATFYGVPKADCRSATRLVSDLARSGSVSRRLQHIEPPLIQDTGIAIYGGAEFFRGSPEREGCDTVCRLEVWRRRGQRQDAAQGSWASWYGAVGASTDGGPRTGASQGQGQRQE